MEQTTTTSGNEVIIRLKRKRNEKPLDALMIQALEDEQSLNLRKRKAVLANVTTSMSNLKTESDGNTNTEDLLANEQEEVPAKRQRFVFERFETISAPLQDDLETESLLGNKRDRDDGNDNSTNTTAQGFREVRRFKATGFDGRTTRRKGNKKRYHVIDLSFKGEKDERNSLENNEDEEEDEEKERKEKKNAWEEVEANDISSTVTSNEVTVPKTEQSFNYILTPMERMMDEAVYIAFKTGKFDKVTNAIQNGASVNYQRKNCDQVSALMAAAFHGDIFMASSLIKMGADPLLKDSHNKDAIDIAMDRNFKDVAMIMRKTGDNAILKEYPDDYVYDVYKKQKVSHHDNNANDQSLQPIKPISTSETIQEDKNIRPVTNTEDGQLNKGREMEAESNIPIVELTGLNYEDNGEVSDLEVLFETDSDESDAERQWDDEDSNAESWDGNDYPDDPTSSDESEDDNDDRRMPDRYQGDYQGDDYYSSDDEFERLATMGYSAMGGGLDEFGDDESDNDDEEEEYNDVAYDDEMNSD